MAFAAVTILMDTLHQHFLQPTPRFPLRNKTKVKLLYKHLSSLQTCLEQDFKVGECDEALKALEAQMRDVSIELRFQIEHELRLFYLGKSMKLRLHSAQKLLPILNGAIKDGIETMDLECVGEMLRKHFVLPVSGMPAHIKKRVLSFCTQYNYLFFKRWSQDEKESEDEEESGDEQESEDEKESEDEEESGDEQESEDELESRDEKESEDELESGDEKESEDECEQDEQKSDDEQERRNEWETKEETNDEHEESDDEWETEEEQNSDDEWETEVHVLCEVESIIRQELRAPSYLNKYMKQRIQARHKIHQIFMQGIKLTSYIKKEVLKVKNAHYNQSNTSQGNNTSASLTVGDSLQHTTIETVGCDDEFHMIMNKLNQASKQREIVSIVGMGGIGKTTLAKRIYGDASFISRFHSRAWVTISQDYNPIKVLNALLRSLDPTWVEGEEKNELAMRVDKCVKGKRYLIVIDDIWSTNVLDDLLRCFKDGKNGSRMLLTTRLKNVAEYADSRGNLCHNMRFLDSYESWNLFRKQVLPQRRTLSHEFERIGREIVKKCKGLPLAINVVAGLLSNPKQDLNEWELIAKNVHKKLDFDGYYSQNEPLNIWGLPQLKTLTTLGKSIRLAPPRSVHHNLESIKYLDYRSCTKELFMRIPNLKTLGVMAGCKINLKRKAFNWFESLACLYKLEDLLLHGKLLHPKFSTLHFTGTLSLENFLPNLKRLKLFNTRLNWKNMYIVEMLPKLEVLILGDVAAVGRKWKPTDRGFPGLKFLIIEYCDLQIWKATGDHFPVLECLVLMHLYYFEKIPSNFADITTLKSIKLYECSKSAISSAKCIKKEKLEYGNDAFTVDILRDDDFDYSLRQ